MDDFDLKKQYYFKGNKIGCLLIHGFTSTPAELRELGENLHKEGFTVIGVQLKGHGTDVKDMENCKYSDWLDSAIDSYNQLKKVCDKIYLIGHSMGALIAMYIAENFHVDRIVTLSPPLINVNKKAKLAGIGKYFIRYVEWPSRERSAEERKYLLGYKKIPIKSLDEFNKLNRKVKKNLGKINSPILIVHSHNDQTVDKKSVSMLSKKVNSKIKETFYVHTSGHNITVEGDKYQVFDATIGFLKS